MIVTGAWRAVAFAPPITASALATAPRRQAGGSLNMTSGVGMVLGRVLLRAPRSAGWPRAASIAV